MSEHLTFLPFSNFHKTMESLESIDLEYVLRLSNYLLECVDAGKEPFSLCSKMWHGYPDALRQYFNVAVFERDRRGLRKIYPMRQYKDKPIMPWWFSDEAVHKSHQSVLIRRNSAAYFDKFPGTPLGLELVWPT